MIILGAEYDVVHVQTRAQHQLTVAGKLVNDR